MMRVKVIPPIGCDRSRLDERGWMEVPEGSTVNDVLKLIRCNPVKAKVMMVSVNGEKTELRRKLCDGDVIGFFSLVSGG